MSDIVELLQVPYEDYLLDNALDDIKADAADEILRLRAQRDKLKEALKLMIDTQDDWETSVAKVIGKQPSVFNRAIDAARAALGEMK